MPARINNTPAVRKQLAEALIAANYDATVAARALGISREAFIARLQRLAERPRVEVSTSTDISKA